MPQANICGRLVFVRGESRLQTSGENQTDGTRDALLVWSHPSRKLKSTKDVLTSLTKQFTNTVKHATHKTHLSINRETQKVKGYNITLTTTQVQEVIKQRKNNNSHGHGKLNSRHLKHIGPLGLAFLTSMFKTALNKNIIPHIYKLLTWSPSQTPTKT